VPNYHIPLQRHHAYGKLVGDSPSVRPYFDCLVLLLLPTILNLATAGQLYLSRSTVSIIFLLLLLKNVFVYSAMSASWSRRVNDAFLGTFHSANKTLWLLIILIIFLVVSELRGFYAGTSSFFSGIGLFFWSFSLLGYLLSVAALNSNDQARRMLLTCLICGLGLFVLANVLGYYLGLRGFNQLEAIGQNQILSHFGLNISRVALPFSSGLNNFGTLAGLGAVSGLCLFWSGRGFVVTSAGLFTFAICLVSMVLVDSRAPLGLSVASCFIVLAATKSARVAWGIRFLPYVVFLAPFLVFGIAWILSDTEFANSVGRDGEFAKRLGLLTGRDVVWISALQILAMPDLIHLIGFGTIGQRTSGATLGYSWIFGQISGLSANSLHNANLQMIFDIGYIGFIFWFLFWVSLLRLVSNSLLTAGDSLYSAAIAGFSIFIALSGVFEVGGTLYFPDMFIMLFFIVAWTISVKPSLSTQKPH